jgi:DnaJ-class molecular chaperone
VVPENLEPAVLAVQRELDDAKSSRLDKRKKLFKKLLLQSHPDKQKGNEEVAKRVFQYLQERKSEFLEAEEPFSD